MPDRFHWLVDVAGRAELIEPGDLKLSAEASIDEAWQVVSEATGMDEEQLAQLVADHFRLQRANVDAIDSHVLKLIPESFARTHVVIPLREDFRQITVATCDPTDLAAEQALGFASGREPVFEVAAPSEILAAINDTYSPNKLMNDILTAVGAEGLDDVRLVEEVEAEEDGGDEGDVDTGPVVKLTNLILRNAVVQGVSDLHFEPGKGGGAVRFRIDGVLRRHMQLPLIAMKRVVSRIKIMGHLDIADHLRPQDGRARIVVNDQEYDLRISTVPTREAEKAVIRVLDTGATRGLEDLGIGSDETARLRRCLSFRDGIVIVTGPTGSGKTTTLYAALQEIATDEVNIMTVEDPVEYELSGVTQIQVAPKRGVTFASALRAILRQDPDVIFLGEIRDLETAQIAVQASATGHLVLATVHTNDAVSVVQRLVDLGLDRPSISVTLRAVLAQRLLRRLCPECATPVEGQLDAETMEFVIRHGVEPGRIRTGCSECGETGYNGRLPIAELLVVDSTFQDLIIKGGSHRELTDVAKASGMRPLAQIARGPVASGLTTLDEMERVLGEPTIAEGEAAPVSDADVDTATVGESVEHILLVDDDAVNRTLARTLLEKSGYQVSEADDGAVAMERLRSDAEYSLMLLDLDMPRMGGREVLQEVRSDFATAGLPVVVLTGTQDAVAEVQLMDAGADDYIRKPIDPPRFVSRIRATLRRASL